MTTEHELDLLKMLAKQSEGGHHVSLLYIDVPRTPDHHPCTNKDMAGAHFVTAAIGHATIKLPEGFAIKIPAGKQILLESHYINTMETPMALDDTVELHLVKPGQVVTHANIFWVRDDDFTIPAHSSYQSAMVCSVPRDLNVLFPRDICTSLEGTIPLRSWTRLERPRQPSTAKSGPQPIR